MRSTLVYLAIISLTLIALPMSSQGLADSVVLSGTIGRDAKQTQSLVLILRNGGTAPVTIMTGMTVGGTSYPESGFRFSLRYKDGHESKLFCTSCGNGPMTIAGSVGAYEITLSPNQVFNVRIPVIDLRASDGNRSLCTFQTAGALLKVTLIGRRPQDLIQDLHPKSQPTGNNSESGAVYWTGTVSESIPVTCSDNRM